MLVGAGFASILNAIFYASQHIILVRHEHIKGDYYYYYGRSGLPSPLQLSVLLTALFSVQSAVFTIEMTGIELCNMSN